MKNLIKCKMYFKLNVVNTEYFCKLFGLISYLNFKKIMSRLQETIIVKKVGQSTLVTRKENYKKNELVKKVGLSTLVIKNKKCAKCLKKAGSHTNGRKIINIITTSVLVAL